MLVLDDLLPQQKTSKIVSNITAVERDTGVSKDTLRMWERRYGFPSPERDAAGERAYPEDQVAKLRVLKRLTDCGMRPGKIILLPLDELRRMSTQSTPLATNTVRVDQIAVDAYLDLLRQHDIERFRINLAKDIATLGIANAIKHLIAPLTYAVGEAWRAGRLEIFEEHLFTESLHVLLRGAINNVPRATQTPRVLLTTFNQEPHSLGLLMAEAVFALEGCTCISLGTQTPVWDIVQAAQRQQADVVALSFSQGMGRQMVIDGLRELRHQLPPRIEIWAGGSATALGRRMGEGVIATQSLDDVSIEVARWRALHTAKVLR